MDFKKATEHFSDTDFDGEPVVIYNPTKEDPPVPPDPPKGDDEDDDDDDDGGGNGIRRIVVSGVPAKIINELIEYIGDEGKLITESYKDYSQKQVKQEYASLDDFLRHWNAAGKKQVILDLLEEHGVILENLAEIVGKDFSDFDLICHVAFGQPPLTRKERAENVKKRDYFTKYGTQAKAVLHGLLEMYADKGVKSIENAKVLKLKPFTDIGTPMEIINTIFGGKTKYELAIKELENELFKQEKTA